MIVSGDLGQQIMPRVQTIDQLDAIYVFSGNTAKHELWTKEWSKVKGVFPQIENLCDSLEEYTQQCDKYLSPVSIISSNNASNPDLDRLDQSFMYSQLLKEIILELKQDDDKAKKQFVEFCRLKYCDNQKKLQVINKFEQDYDANSAIWWYTKEPFIYEMLNRALRTQDTAIVIQMRFFLRDLHQQIMRLHTESTDNRKPMTIYRGQGILDSDFEKMINSEGGLLSLNNFLSTSGDEAVSSAFAQSAKDDPNLIGILFQIKVVPELVSTPFALLDEVGSYADQEKEILFSMHTVFRIGAMKQIEHRLWKVELELTRNNDQQLTRLTQYIRKEIEGETGWDQLGHLLIRIGEFDQAEEIYNTILDSTADADLEAVAYIYHQLGYINNEKGYHSNALSFFQKAAEIFEKSFSPNHLLLAGIYNNIGAVHRQVGDYSTTLSFYQKALKIFEKLLAPDHPDLATTYNNIGELYQEMKDYSSALSFHQKTIEIREKSLPPNHPDLSIAYGNIGLVYQEMGKYSSALSFYQKALEIEEKSLPPNHPDLATSYNNIGFVHQAMKNYSISLSFFQKSLEIEEKSLRPNHPSLTATYNNIGTVYLDMKEYSNALSFFKKTLEIFEKSLPPNHPDLAHTYDNIASVHQAMKNHPAALSFYEKAIEIQEKYFPANHPSLAIIYNNIGSLYQEMKDYSNALSFFTKTFEILEKNRPPNHPDLAITCNNMASSLEGLHRFHVAVEYCERAVNIACHSLASDHPNMRTYLMTLDRIRKKL